MAKFDVERQRIYKGKTYTVGDFLFCTFSGMYRLLHFLPTFNKARVVKVATSKGSPSGRNMFVVALEDVILVPNENALANLEVEKLTEIRNTFQGYTEIMRACQK